MNIFETNFKDDFNYISDTIGESIKINGKSQTALITKGDNKDRIIDYRNIKTTFPISTGDLVSYQNQNWLVVSEINQSKNSYKGSIRKAPHTLKVYINNKLEEIPAIIETFSQDMFDNGKIRVKTGNLKITMQDNSVTKKINDTIRFIKMQNAYKVINYTSENKGLKYIYAEQTEFHNGIDDIENEIANRWEHEVKHDYSMTIAEENISIEVGQNKQLIINVTDNINGKVETVVNPTIIYTSTDSNIITVDDKGLIKTITKGETTIKMQFENIEKIVNVKVAEVTKIQLEIIGKDELALGRSRVYNSNISCTWSVEDVNNKTSIVWVTITSQTDTSITIKITDKWIFNDNSSKYFKIIAINKDDNTRVEKQVRIIPY